MWGGELCIRKVKLIHKRRCHCLDVFLLDRVAYVIRCCTLLPVAFLGGRRGGTRHSPDVLSRKLWPWEGPKFWSLRFVIPVCHLWVNSCISTASVWSRLRRRSIWVDSSWRCSLPRVAFERGRVYTQRGEIWVQRSMNSLWCAVSARSRTIDLIKYGGY